METGWIKLHRKLLKNPVVMKDADHLAVWVYLLLKATRVVHNSIFDGKNVLLKPGQLIIGRRVIGSDMGIHESKVQRILKCFESEDLFKQQTGNRSRLITILKWKDYQISEQVSEQQMNNSRTTDEQQPNTIQEVLELKEDKEVKERRTIFFQTSGLLVESMLMRWGITLDQLNNMLDDFDLHILAEGKDGITDAEYRSYFHNWGGKRYSKYKGSVTQNGMVF